MRLWAGNIYIDNRECKLSQTGCFSSLLSRFIFHLLSILSGLPHDGLSRSGVRTRSTHSSCTNTSLCMGRGVCIFVHTVCLFKKNPQMTRTATMNMFIFNYSQPSRSQLGIFSENSAVSKLRYMEFIFICIPFVVCELGMQQHLHCVISEPTMSTCPG